MRAANEIPAAERLKPSTTMDQEDYEKACEQLHQVDHRIPPEVIKRAVQLFFSTNLLPGYDLSTCHVRELPSTNMLALIMPLPDTSHFQMPPPFGKRQNHTWALLHGTSLHTSHKFYLKARSDQQTGPIIRILNVANYQPLGHSSLAEKFPTVTRRSHLGQNGNSSMPLARRERASKISSLGRCIKGPLTIQPTTLEATKRLSLG